MNTFIAPLKELKEFNDIRDNIITNTLPVQVTGCLDSQKCHLAYALGKDFRYKVIVTYSDIKAKEIYEDYRLYDKDVILYPAKDIIFYSADIHGNAIVRDRLKVLRRLLEKQKATIIMTLDGGMDRLLPLTTMKDRILRISMDSIIDLHKFSGELVHLGYEKDRRR